MEDDLKKYLKMEDDLNLFGNGRMTTSTNKNGRQPKKKERKIVGEL
jgi:hypothetical protein